MVNLSIIVMIGLSSIVLAGPPFRRLSQKFFDFLSEHSTPYEQADRIVQVLCAEYPEPFCETVEDRILLKRELIHFYASEKEERNEVVGGFCQTVEACSFVERMAFTAIRKLQALAKEFYPTLDEKHKWIKNEKHLMMHLFMKPLYQFALEKQKKHKGWSKEEIRKDFFSFHVANQRRLMEVFHKDDPDQRLVERANARLRRRNEL
ncbi:hypothetical protein PRIPAC_91408 [Pristionchus pacificus]|uniref:Uncharacterized protein n=1 Tax=Pristionchus pacificus TaxID=54126 RepID=A0A2A6B774_PRIPA|nr:hypothetical protein PRIPAC_91408 [Pristionchus pacificus]|eukprot:PDM61703.1 hypothetical protein PRIPAC_51145 [Pristionchus pacificus]